MDSLCEILCSFSPEHAADVSAEESDSDHSETGQCVDAAAPTPGCSHSTTNQGKRSKFFEI